MGDRDAKGPIYSSRADDPDLGERIDAFVLVLAERIDALQDAESRAELVQVATLARTLGCDAEAAGYDACARCAAEIETASLGGAAQETHGRLVELTEIATRIRLGHRGAA